MPTYPNNAYGNMQAVRDLIKHKLDVDGVTYTDSSSLNHLTYKLNDLSTVDSSTSTVNIPTYDSGVSNIYSNFNKYYTFLKGVMNRSGFSTTRVQGETWGLTTLVNRIKFTPTLSINSSPSTIDVGDTVTLTATLELNNVPISGASVEFYDASDDTLLDTITTDNNGEAEYSFTYNTPLTVYCVFGETSDYINVSSSNIEVSEYLFYDECNNANNLSKYNSSIHIQGTQGTSTISYDTTNNAYKILGSGNYLTGHMIPALDGKTNYKITAEFKVTNNNVMARTGFAVHNKNGTNSTYNDVYQVMGYSRVDYTAYSASGSYDGVTTLTSSASTNKWTKLVLTIPSTGNSYNIKVYNSNGTQLSSNNITGKVSANSNIQVGLFYQSDNQYPAYVRNIKAERL